MTIAPTWLWSLIGSQRDEADLYVRLDGLDWMAVHMRRVNRSKFASTHAVAWYVDRAGSTAHISFGRTPAERDPFSPTWPRVWQAGDAVVLLAGYISVTLDVGSTVKQRRIANPIARTSSAATPCASCIFRNDQPGYVPRAAVESALTMPPDMSLVCHESGGTRVCAGWRLFRLRAGLADANDEPFGLDLAAPVFGSVAELMRRVE